MKKLLLLGLLLLSGCKSTISPSSIYQKLKDGETLIIWFREPIEERRDDKPDLSITNDDINWYRIKDNYFILDYKYDPGTYYINADFIAIWGIER